MATKHHVIIIQKEAVLPEGFRQALKSKGYATSVVDSEKEALRAIESNNEVVVVVYCAKDEVMSKVTGELAEMKALHPHPLIIVGNGLESYESFLNRHFILATSLSLPCSNSDILSAITYVTKYVERIKKQRERQSTTEEDTAAATKSLLQEFYTIPTAIFKKFEELGLVGKEVGGATYATTFRPQELSEKFYYPKSDQNRGLIQEIVISLNAQQISRFHRVGLLSHLILEAIGLSAGVLEDAKTAAHLYSYGFFNSSRNVAVGEYLSPDKQLLRKEICSLVKDSVMALGPSISGGSTAAIIQRIGKLIGDEEVLDDSVVSIAASAIATADAIDRVVFQRNVFQPVATYCVLSRLKRENISFIHPLVLAVLVKILAESVTSIASGISVNKKILKASRLINAAEQIEDIVLRQGESHVPLQGLIPGMRLARPVKSYDGRDVLDEPVLLDQDLIWRLWQLAAIRPMQKNISVTKVTDTE